MADRLLTTSSRLFHHLIIMQQDAAGLVGQRYRIALECRLNGFYRSSAWCSRQNCPAQYPAARPTTPSAASAWDWPLLPAAAITNSTLRPSPSSVLWRNIRRHRLARRIVWQEWEDDAFEVPR